MQDKVVPNGKWAFDESVTTAFNDMLARSIPEYTTMRKAVNDLTAIYAKSSVLDLGCSRGEAIAELVQTMPHIHFTGCEISDPMLDVLHLQFGNTPNVTIQKIDLRTEYPQGNFDVVLSILTLQFTPIEYRQAIIQSIYNSIPSGGCFILVEKVLGNTAPINKNMIDLYYQLKGDNGYTYEQIERKRLSLEGVLVPVTAKWNEELMYSSGFKAVDCFWRWMNFAGWIAIK